MKRAKIRKKIGLISIGFRNEIPMAASISKRNRERDVSN